MGVGVIYVASSDKDKAKNRSRRFVKVMTHRVIPEIKRQERRRRRRRGEGVWSGSGSGSDSESDSDDGY